MPKFRKKPVVIEAQRFTQETKNQVFNWITCTRHPKFRNGLPVIVINTLEGDMIASVGDWIIKGVAGEFYPCKPDIFEQTYEAVEEPTNA